MTFRVFISSVQDEFAEERRRLKQWLTTDLFVSRFVEVRLFADRVEIWTPGALPEGITIPELYETHSSYPVNELVLKVFDFAGIIESLGTGIERMIKACRTANLPDPTWKQQGHSLIVTIWKDVWTDARLSELGIGKRQRIAIDWIKRHRQIAAADYMALTGVARNTATRDLNGLVKLGVFASSGGGKHTVYRLCTIYAPYAPSEVGPDETPINKGVLSSHDPTKSPVETINEPVNGPVNGPLNEPRKSIEEIVYSLITSNPGISRPQLISRIGKSRTTISRALIRLKGRIEHRGSDKTGGYYALCR